MSRSIILTISTCFFIIFISCEDAPKKIDKPIVKQTEKTTKHYLDNMNISLELPKGYVKSSKFRLTNDLPILNSDSFLLLNVERLLNIMEFHDRDVDFFIDTANQEEIHFFTLIDTKQVPLDKRSGQLLNKQYDQNFEELERETNHGILSLKISADFKENNTGQYFKFKHRLDYNDLTRFITFYILSSPRKTYVVHEFSDKRDDLEEFVTNLKE